MHTHYVMQLEASSQEVAGVALETSSGQGSQQPGSGGEPSAPRYRSQAGTDSSLCRGRPFHLLAASGGRGEGSVLWDGQTPM